MRLRATSWTALLVLASWGSAGAQTGGGYDLTWNSLDCGSPVTSNGAGYLLGGTTGQPESGQLAGGGYLLQVGFGQGSVTPTDAPPSDERDEGTLVFRLYDGSPNPFATRTAISFSTARSAGVRLGIYDLGGRVIRTVLDQQVGPGRHQAIWDGKDDGGQDVARGVYFLRLRAGSFEARKKLVLLR